jgi:hypothetical protein
MIGTHFTKASLTMVRISRILRDTPDHYRHISGHFSAYKEGDFFGYKQNSFFPDSTTFSGP